MNLSREQKIRERLIAELLPEHLEVDNESSMHSVPKGSETHFKVLIVSAKFAGLKRVDRQRLIYEALGDELKNGLHALSLRALDPAQWQEVKAELNFKSPPCHGKPK